MALTTLRLLGPGVPDTYQGTELWDLSLVDPDNRRPVDYAERAALLASVEHTPAVDAWASQLDSGAAKLALIRACLGLRRGHARAFGPEGSYAALDVSGADATRVVAFSRGDAVIAVIPRLPGLGSPDEAMVVLAEGNWINSLTDEHHTGEVAFGKLRGGFPVAVLQRDGDPVG